MSRFLERLAEAGESDDSLAWQLFFASEAADYPRIVNLLSSGTVDPEIAGSMLSWAAQAVPRAAGIDIARAALAAGADVDFQEEPEEYTPLAFAVRARNIDLVRLLVAAGGDPTRGSTSALDCGFAFEDEGMQAIVEELLQARPRKPGREALVAAALYGAPNIARQAIDAGVDPNSEDDVGIPALLIAAGEGHVEIVRMLLESGASPNSAVAGGLSTALTAAVQGRCEEAARILIEAGADVNARRASDNCTALEIAERLGEPAIAQLIREAGATG